MQKDRIVFLDALRIIAMIGVITVHVSAIGMRGNVRSSVYIVSSIYNAAVRWCVPVFFMISGAVFLRDEKRYSFRDMALKYSARMLGCYLLWAIVYCLLDIALYGKFTVRSVFTVAVNVITNNSGYHLWYLFALVALYLLVPVLRIIVSNLTQKQLAYILLLWMVLSLGVNQLNEILSQVGVSIDFKWYFPVLSGWSGYFLLGYYLTHYQLPPKAEKAVILVGVIAVVVSCSANVMSSMLLQKKIDAFSSQSGLTACIEAAAIWIVFSRHTFSERAGRFVQDNGKYVFGIYLSHALINSILFHVVKARIDFCPAVIAVPVYTVLVCMLSWSLVLLLGKNAYTRKLIGLR